MRVVGQFNLGFILATLGEDLFIVDQHASDEVYNFERLQRVTTLNRQPLIAPARLGLTAAEEQTVRRHADVFLANGFGFCEDAESGATGPPGAEDAAAGCAPGCCLALQSVPFSKGTTFGVADVHELIGMLDDGAYAAPARRRARRLVGDPVRPLRRVLHEIRRALYAVHHGVSQRQRGAAHQAHRLGAGRRHERVQRCLPGARERLACVRVPLRNKTRFV